MELSTFKPAILTATKDPDVGNLSALLGDAQARTRSAFYYFVDDEYAMRELCKAFGGTYPDPNLKQTGIADARLFEWAGLFPLPPASFRLVAKSEGPGAKNVIIMHTSPQSLDKVGRVSDDKREPWQREDLLLYVGERVLVFPVTTNRLGVVEPVRDMTDAFLQGGLHALLKAVGEPVVNAIFVNPSKKDLSAYTDTRLYDALLEGIFNSA